MNAQLLPYGEDVKVYWGTSQTAPDTWLDKAQREIVRANGETLMRGMISDLERGVAAYMLSFRFGEDEFKVVWPILPSKNGKEKTARIQAATMLYHDIKARSVALRVQGARAAFFGYLLLPDGRTAAQASTSELMAGVPELLAGPQADPLRSITDGNTVEGLFEEEDGL